MRNSGSIYSRGGCEDSMKPGVGSTEHTALAYSRNSLNTLSMASQALYKLWTEQGALNRSLPKALDSKWSCRWTTHSILPGTFPVLKLEIPSPRKANCEVWSPCFLRDREMDWRKNIHSSILPHTTIKANAYRALLTWNVLAPAPCRVHPAMPPLLPLMNPAWCGEAG